MGGTGVEVIAGCCVLGVPGTAMTRSYNDTHSDKERHRLDTDTDESETRGAGGGCRGWSSCRLQQTQQLQRRASIPQLFIWTGVAMIHCKCSGCHFAAKKGEGRGEIEGLLKSLAL